ncbi:MAG: hypothetical protein RL263_1458 [Bacteroidota bacterium]
MQKIILIFLSLLGLSSANAQSFCSAPKIQRHTTVSASSVTKIQPHAIVAAAGGGFWATGTITTSADKLDFMVAKFNDSGRLVLLKRMGTSGDETSYPIGLAPTATGGCVIGGRSDDPNVGAGLAALAYINSDGTLKWWRRTTSNGNSGRYDAFRNVLVRKNGTVLAAVHRINGTTIHSCFLQHLTQMELKFLETPTGIAHNLIWMPLLNTALVMLWEDTMEVHPLY